MCCYHSLQSQVWIVVRRIGMLLITIFVELRVVAGRSRSRAGSPQAVSQRPCCAVALRRTEWSEMAWARHGHGMASMNQTRPQCVNQMGKTHSKPFAARHGIGTACYVLNGLKTAIIQTSAAVQLWPSIFCGITQCLLVVGYQTKTGKSRYQHS